MTNQSANRGGFRRHFEWWERAYITDWLFVFGIFFLALFAHGIPVFERDFDVNDPLINHKYHKNQRVPDTWLHILTFWIPFFLTALLGALKGSSHNFHHAALALCSGMSLTNLVVEFLKNRVGRLRPDFLSRCAWDEVLKECTGKHSRIISGRRSFPSGHSASAFAGLGFVFLLLAGQTESLLVTSSISRRRSFLSSKLLRLGVTIMPLVLATWIAITRMEDYRHHKEDVIAGSLIGFSIAFLCYTVYWPNPFRAPPNTSANTTNRADRSIRGLNQPKYLYRPILLSSPETGDAGVNGEMRDRRTEVVDREGAEQFELAPMVEENVENGVEVDERRHEEERGNKFEESERHINGS